MKKNGSMKTKFYVSLLLALVLLFTSPLQAFAAVGGQSTDDSQQTSETDADTALQNEDTVGVPRVIPHTVRELFDAEYYLLLYPDLSDLGDDPDVLYENFIEYGLKAGRKCSPYLDLARYISENKDLQESFGDNWDAYVDHYFTIGIKEGRSSYATDFDRYLQSVLKSAVTVDRQLYGQALLDFSFLQSKTSETWSCGSDDDLIPEKHKIHVHDDTIIIPWDYVEHGYVTLDMIKEHCGENLILVQNEQGDVTFLAGDISSKSVTDEAAALKVVESMFGVLKLDDEENLYLSLTSTKTDSEGNSIYEFMALDQASGRYATTITDVRSAKMYSDGKYQAVVRLKAGSDGTVIALSTTSEGSYTRYQTLNADGKVVDSRSATISKELSAAVKEKYEILGEYDNYQGGMLYKDEYFVKDKKDGTIGILYYDYNNKSSYFYKIDQEVYYASNGKDSYPLDYLLNQASYENMTLKDYFGNEVTVPVAHMVTAAGENVYYLASKTDKTIMFARSGSLVYDSATVDYSADDLVKLTMGNDGTLTPVNPSLNMGDLVCMYSYILDGRKFFYSVDPVKADSSPFIINYYYEDRYPNAFGGESFGLMTMEYENCYFLRTYDTAIHESTHSMTLEQFFPTYTNYNGAMSEGYADIMGLCMQQKKYDELVSDYMSRNEATLEQAKEYVGSHFADFSDTWYASYYQSPNGRITYLYDADDPCNKHQEESYATKVGDTCFGYFPYALYPTYDNYNCHANSSVLSHIAYEMYKNGIVSDEEELAAIWYDSISYVTGESEFYDVRYYVEECMKEHGFSKEAIEATDQLFEDSNVTLETRSQNLLATPEKLKTENNLGTTAGETIQNLQQNTLDNEQAARVSVTEEETQQPDTDAEEVQTPAEEETITAEDEQNPADEEPVVEEDIQILPE